MTHKLCVSTPQATASSRCSNPFVRDFHHPLQALGHHLAVRGGTFPPQMIIHNHPLPILRQIKRVANLDLRMTPSVSSKQNFCSTGLSANAR